MMYIFLGMSHVRFCVFAVSLQLEGEKCYCLQFRQRVMLDLF